MDTYISFIYLYNHLVWLKGKDGKYNGKSRKTTKYAMRINGFTDIIPLTKEGFHAAMTKSIFKWKWMNENDGFVWYYPTKILKKKPDESKS